MVLRVNFVSGEPSKSASDGVRLEEPPFEHLEIVPPKRRRSESYCPSMWKFDNSRLGTPHRSLLFENARTVTRPIRLNVRQTSSSREHAQLSGPPSKISPKAAKITGRVILSIPKDLPVARMHAGMKYCGRTVVPLKIPDSEESMVSVSSGKRLRIHLVGGESKQCMGKPPVTPRRRLSNSLVPRGR